MAMHQDGSDRIASLSGGESLINITVAISAYSNVHLTSEPRTTDHLK